MSSTLEGSTALLHDTDRLMWVHPDQGYPWLVISGIQLYYKHTSSSHLLYKTVWGVGVAIQKKWSSIIDSIRICLAYFELWAHRSLYHELASTFRNIQWENLDTCATDWRRRNVSLPVQTRWWLSSKTIIIASTERWPVCWFRPEADLLTYCSY